MEVIFFLSKTQLQTPIDTTPQRRLDLQGDPSM